MKRRMRISLIAGLATFALLAALAPAVALWNMNATVQTAVTVADVRGCNRTGLLNGGFENPSITNGNYSLRTPTSWTGTNAAGATLAGEIWNTPFVSNNAPQGEQLIEMNSTDRGTMSQTLTTTPGTRLGWSFYHKGRGTTAETARISIGAPGTLVAQGSDVSGTNESGWAVHSGTYVVPAGQTSTTISIRSISGGTAGAGNLLDGVAFGVGPCLTSSSTVTEVGGTAGSYVAGDRVQYTTTIQNTGDAPGLSTGYAFTLPSSLELVAGTLAVTDPAKVDTPGASVPAYDPVTRVISAGIGDRPLDQIPAGRIFPGSSITVTFDAIIQASGTGTTVSYAPSVTTASQLAPTWTMNGSPTKVDIAVVSPNADVAVSAVTTPLTAFSGASTTWDFRATNNGPNDAAGVSASLLVPVELTGVSVRYSTSNNATTSPVTCTLVATTATCPLGSIPTGQIRRFWVTGTIPTTYTANTNPRPMTVTASTTATTGDATPANNTLAYTASVQRDTTGPSTPTLNNITSPGRTSVPLSWSASTDAGSGIGGYEVWRDGTTLVATLTGPGTSYTVSGLTPNTTYFFQIRAYDAAGNRGAWSPSKSVTTAP